MMPGAEAHIAVQSQDEIHMMLDFSQYHPNQFRHWSMPRLNIITRKPNRNICRITERLQLQSQITNESQFRDPSFTATEPQWQSTIHWIQKSSTEQRIFKEGDCRVYTIKSYQQAEAHREVDQEVYQEVDQDSTEAAYLERNPEIDRMVTKADFE
jgi:hypothetical protein